MANMDCISWRRLQLLLCLMVSGASASTLGNEAAGQVNSDQMSWLMRMASPRMMRAEREKLASIEVSFAADVSQASSHDSNSMEQNPTTTANPLLPPIDCQLTEWSPWGDCAATCGYGSALRTRTVAVYAANGGFDCDGAMTETLQNCTGRTTGMTCPNECVWSSWGNWGKPTSDCAGAAIFRNRTIVREAFGNGSYPWYPHCNPADAYSSSLLPTTKECDMNCTWSDWSSWSGCSSLCIGGTQRSYRIVIQPQAGKGLYCNQSANTTYQPCNSQYKCPTDCLHSAWTDWTLCSVTCGQGVRKRNVTYTPATGNNFSGYGMDCYGKFGITNSYPLDSQFWTGQYAGPNVQYQELDCNWGACVVNCTYSSWQPWTACSATCGWGTKSNMRVSRNNPPQPSCTNYTGAVTQTAPCQLGECPVNCTYNNWQRWSDCPTCGNYTRARTRTTNISASLWGFCDNYTYENTSCPIGPCPVDCMWDAWDTWTTCSITCGWVGEQVQNRTRPMIEPSFGGSSCPPLRGSSTVTMECFPATPCSGDCKWQLWSEWTTCSEQCGGGFRISQRSTTWAAPVLPAVGKCMTNSSGNLTNANCQGDTCIDIMNASCNTQSCAMDCEWSPWSEWSSCNQGCQQDGSNLYPGGVMYMFRQSVLTPQSDYTRQPLICSGENATNQTGCGVPGFVCPAPCAFDSWSAWSSCSVTCGGGSMYKNRTIITPAVTGSNGQAGLCDASSTTLPCGFGACGCWGDWTAWSRCTAACAGGKQNASRVPAVADTTCDGNAATEQDCNTGACVLVAFLDITVGNTHTETEAFTQDALAGKALQEAFARITKIPATNISVTMTLLFQDASLVQFSARQLEAMEDGPPANIHVVYIMDTNPDDMTEALSVLQHLNASYLETLLQDSFTTWGIDSTYLLEGITAVACIVTDTVGLQDPSTLVYSNEDYAVGDLTVANHNPKGYVPIVDQANQATVGTDTANTGTATAVSTGPSPSPRSLAVRREAMMAVGGLLLLAMI